MKYRTISLKCPTRKCGLAIAFKVPVPPDHDDLATTVQREWKDCPKCSERRELACLVPASDLVSP